MEYGNDLVGWDTAVHDGDDVIIETGTPGPDTTPVTVKLKRSTLAPGGKVFVRLQSVVTIP